jgi:hypothetical protein
VAPGRKTAFEPTIRTTGTPSQEDNGSKRATFLFGLVNESERAIIYWSSGSMESSLQVTVQTSGGWRLQIGLRDIWKIHESSKNARSFDGYFRRCVNFCPARARCGA